MKIKKGFTLIELLVVISIIGILAGLTLVSYTGAQKQTRDTQRKSDLGQYRTALEAFAAANDGFYPGRNARQNVNPNLCSDLSEFLSACLTDPKNYVYYYETDGSNDGTADATVYVSAVQLETGGNWEVCSNGRSGKTACDAATDNSAICTVGTTDPAACP